MASDTFDAVLAEGRKIVTFRLQCRGENESDRNLAKLLDRLSAAHAAEVAERDARIAELEVAIGQAVEFAQYVEDAAKGAMAERAKHYLSQPYAQELAARLARAEAAERDARRYRWLRTNCVREWESDMPDDKGAPSLDIDFDADGHDLDAAIDAAIATTEQDHD